MQLGLATAPALFAWRELGDEMGTMIKRKFKHPGDVQNVSFGLGGLKLTDSD